MSNALVSKNSNYEPVKQQTKSSELALEPPSQSSGGVVCYYYHKLVSHKGFRNVEVFLRF